MFLIQEPKENGNKNRRKLFIIGETIPKGEKATHLGITLSNREIVGKKG